MLLKSSNDCSQHTQNRNAGVYQCGKIENVKQEIEIIHAGRERRERGHRLILDKDHRTIVPEYWRMSNRVLPVKLKTKPFNTHTSQSTK